MANQSRYSHVHDDMSNHRKLDKIYSKGAFGMSDVPTKLGHKLQAWIEDRDLDRARRDDKRSWKRRRKTRWRTK